MFFHARRVTSEMGLSLTQEWKHVQDLRKKIKRQMLLSLLPSHIHNTSSTSPDRTYDEIYLTGRDSGDSLPASDTTDVHRASSQRGTEGAGPRVAR